MLEHDCELENCSCTIPLFITCTCCEEGECSCDDCDICESELETKD